MEETKTEVKAEQIEESTEAKVVKKPTQFLQEIIGQNVVVKLSSGIEYRGTMACLDGFMNIALENTVEFVKGVETNTYGDCFIRGNNVLFISAVE